MAEDKKIRVGITQGDTNGIGYEVILKTLADGQMCELCTPVVYGSSKIAAYHRKALDMPQVQFNNIDNAQKVRDGVNNLVEVADGEVKIELGVPSEAAGQAYNIAYGGREYLIDIYYGLTKALGVQVEPNFGPDRKGDIKHSNADISKAKRLLGYDPDWSFDRGIQAAIEWYKENL